MTITSNLCLDRNCFRFLYRILNLFLFNYSHLSRACCYRYFVVFVTQLLFVLLKSFMRFFEIDLNNISNSIIYENLACEIWTLKSSFTIYYIVVIFANLYTTVMTCIWFDVFSFERLLYARKFQLFWKHFADNAQSIHSWLFTTYLLQVHFLHQVSRRMSMIFFDSILLNTHVNRFDLIMNSFRSFRDFESFVLHVFQSHLLLFAISSFFVFISMIYFSAC